MSLSRLICQKIHDSKSEKRISRKILFLLSDKRFRKKNLLPKSDFVRTRKELLRKDSAVDPWARLPKQFVISIFIFQEISPPYQLYPLPG